MDKVGVPHTLRDAGIPASDIEKNADEIVTHSCDANGFLSSLSPIGRDGIVKILHTAEGRRNEAHRKKAASLRSERYGIRPAVLGGCGRKTRADDGRDFCLL